MTNITASLTLTCEDNSTAGGTQKLYLINRDYVTEFTADAVTSNHAYTSVTVSSTGAAESQFHEYELYEFTGLGEATNNQGNNGTNTFDINITGFIPREEKVKAKKLQDLIKSCKVIAILQNTTGEAMVYGYDQVLQVRAALSATASSSTGTAIEDQSGYTLTLTGKQVDLPRQFVGTIITSGGVAVTFS